MIWLLFLIPLSIVITLALYFDKKTGAVPPDVNKGNHNVESEVLGNQYNHLNSGGGDSGF
ncbi:hypothetical protein [Metabacillus endolithicus]|uniref:Uncharacterized protein n=1 Tax=Metabacillus endolithicus TaxID=1535204 RepID=A0ABW5BWV1_9BACI|nr:hypothetical protein [Metabacillus endolithicus]UPG63956.1 hypothetical protein MVE64_02105 [Metabacillus endolithicus]